MDGEGMTNEWTRKKPEDQKVAVEIFVLTRVPLGIAPGAYKQRYPNNNFQNTLEGAGWATSTACSAPRDTSRVLVGLIQLRGLGTFAKGRYSGVELPCEAALQVFSEYFFGTPGVQVLLRIIRTCPANLGCGVDGAARVFSRTSGRVSTPG